MRRPYIEVELEDGSTLTWYPGAETPYAVEVIEDFLGPADSWSS